MVVGLLGLCFALSTLGCVNEDVRVVDDPFTGQVRTFIVSLPGGGYQGLQSLAVTEAHGSYSLQATVMTWGSSLAVARAGEPAQFAVGDEVLTLLSTGEARPVARNLVGSGGPVFTQWRVPYVFDAATASRFAAGSMKAFKVRVGSEDIQVSLASWKADTFRKNMTILTAR